MTTTELERVLDVVDEVLLDSVGNASLCARLRVLVRTAVDDLVDAHDAASRAAVVALDAVST